MYTTSLINGGVVDNVDNVDNMYIIVPIHGWKELVDVGLLDKNEVCTIFDKSVIIPKKNKNFDKIRNYLFNSFYKMIYKKLIEVEKNGVNVRVYG